MKYSEIMNFTNTLSNEDLAQLLNCVAPRLIMWVKVDGSAHISEVESASLNGCSVQLNPPKEE
jgi:hypothetical protein